MLVCEGYCQRVFHPKCVGLEALSFDLTTQTAVSSSHPGGGALGAERAFSFHCEDCCDEVIKCRLVPAVLAELLLVLGRVSLSSCSAMLHQS